MFVSTSSDSNTVCSQEELPSQDKMKIGGHNGFMPYMSVAKGIAASLTGPSETAVRECTLYRVMQHISRPHVKLQSVHCCSS